HRSRVSVLCRQFLQETVVAPGCKAVVYHHQFIVVKVNAQSFVWRTKKITILKLLIVRRRIPAACQSEINLGSTLRGIREGHCAIEAQQIYYRGCRGQNGLNLIGKNHRVYVKVLSGVQLPLRSKRKITYSIKQSI